jgi:alpha-1,3-rhamnosyltransferase
MSPAVNVPRVSVCIPSFNHARFLPQTLEGILAQTYQGFEIVIADDGSTDDSLAISKEYASRYPNKIHLFTHEGGINRGISATCNLAVEHSRGEYLAWLGSDDVWYAHKLQAQVELIESSPEVGLVYGLADVIDSEGNMTGEHVGRDITSDPIPMLLAGNYLPALTVLHRRACHTELGLYDERLLYSDWDMWLRIASHYQIAFLNCSLGQYRVHGQNVFAGRNLNTQLRHDSAVIRRLQLEGNQIGGLLAQPHNQALVELRLASLLCSLDGPAEASQQLEAAFTIAPSLFTDIPLLIRQLEAFKAPYRLYPSVLSFIPPSNRIGRWTFESDYFAKEAAAYRRKDLRKARAYAFKCVLRNPRWLGNRQILGVLVESLIGNRAFTLFKNRLLRRGGTDQGSQHSTRQART